MCALYPLAVFAGPCLPFPEDGVAERGPEMPSPARRVVDLLAVQQDFESVFQPIRDLRNGAVAGFEALIRFPGGLFDGPLSAFRAAAMEGLLTELELAALDCHLRRARTLPRTLLFLNVSAPLFLDSRIKGEAFLRRVTGPGLSPGRVVLELTELFQVADIPLFVDSLQALRREGFRLAVDDFGTGFNNIQTLIELSPEFLKIDASLVTGAGRHHRRRTFLEFLADFGARTGCAIIAEGLETDADVDTVKACGIRLGQGWALGRPASAGTHMRALHSGRDRQMARVPEKGEGAVGAIAVAAPLVPVQIAAGRIAGLFEKVPEPPAVVAESQGRVCGLVTKSQLFFHLGHQYGYSLWRDRPLQRFLSETASDFDAISSSAPMEAASDLVRQRPAARRYDPLVVLTENGSYHGVLPIEVLLGEITRLKVSYALHSNPLTGLPGTVVLMRRVEQFLSSGEPFALGWVDIDNFKAFNDCYGFARGDDAILLAAGCLRERIANEDRGILVHPGGDDFAFITGPSEVEELVWAASLEFSRRARMLYRQRDLESGFIRAVDRQGVERTFPLLSVSTGIVIWRGEEGQDYHRLVAMAANVRKAAKAVDGPSVMVNRRSLGESGHGSS